MPRSYSENLLHSRVVPQSDACDDFALYLDYNKMFVSQTEGTLPDIAIQDCLERQFESHLQAVQQSTRLKKQIAATGMQQIQEWHSKQVKGVGLKYKIRKNHVIGEYLGQTLAIRNDQFKSVFKELEDRLRRFATAADSADRYRAFLTVSIVEGLVRMFEEIIYIRCLERDKPIIQKLLPEIHQIYSHFMRSNIGFESPLQLQIANNYTLEESSPSEKGLLDKNKEDHSCIGGVILADRTGNITFKATLDSRFNILKEISIPLVRKMIWYDNEDIPLPQPLPIEEEKQELQG